MRSSKLGASNAGEGSSNTTQTDSAPLDRIRQMLLVPPTQRPPEFENPLEKIEQLLTCPICLDRYKQPKLLPCHHTFCVQCLDSCADIVHRNLKCPECRAEHSLPYDGVKNFQTNFTLLGFLDIHLQATDDNAAQLEAYIQRYNLERCKVCDEKAVLEVCAHCEKRSCSECRSTHMEMLKRDLNRMLNQVKRLSTRIVEASDGLNKGADFLTLNCETTKDEVREYFRRYYRELKKREEMFLEEIETFLSTETRIMRSLRDILEIESTNMSEGCAYLEAALKGEREVQDKDLAKLKNIFSDGLEYLRNFQPDGEDLLSKKLRFSPGDDASKLPMAIANFGELLICHPQFAGRYLPLEQSYLPRPIKIGYESDNYKFVSRKVDVEERPYADSRSTRYSVRNNNDDDLMPMRYHRRRQQMEEEARNRLRFGMDGGRQSPNVSTPGNSPWSQALGFNSTTISNGDSAQNRSENKSNLGDTETSNPARLVVENSGSSTQQPGHNAASKTVELASNTSSVTSVPVPDSVSNISVDVQPQPNSNMVCEKHNEETSTETSLPTDTIISVGAVVIPPQVKVDAVPEPQAIKNINGTTNKPYAKVSRKPPLPSQLFTEDATLNERFESIRAAHEKRRVQRNTDVPVEAPRSSEESESETEPSPPILTGNRFRIICHSQSMANKNKPEKTESVVHEGNMEVEAIPSPVNTIHYPGETPSWLVRRRQRYQRSKTNPDLLSALNNHFITSTTVQNNNTVNNSRIQQLLLERSNRLESSLAQRFVPPTKSENNDMNEMDTSSPPLSDRRSRYRKRNAATERDRSSDARIAILSSPRFTSVIDYKSKNMPKLTFGRKGCKEGELNWPRGIAHISGIEFAVCDSSNHRICIFNTQGRLIRTFGRYGTGNGQLDSAAGICCNRSRHFIVSDRYNHRIVIFDQNGQFVSKFGGHGPSNGRFNNPWGVAVDDSGMIHVVDKDNNRIQTFDAKGQFVRKYGGSNTLQEQLHNPQFIFVHRRTQNIYITDSANHRVVVFDHSGSLLFHFGEEGFHEGEMKNPRGIAVDEQGFIVLADSGNNRVQIFYPDGRFFHTFGSWGTAPGQMKGIEAVAIIDNTIVVSDRENHRIQLF